MIITSENVQKLISSLKFKEIVWTGSSYTLENPLRYSDSLYLFSLYLVGERFYLSIESLDSRWRITVPSPETNLTKLLLTM